LSQQPFLRGEDEGGHTYYRVRDIDKLLGRLGAGAAQVNPVMTHQYLAHFADQAQADRAKDLLSSVRYDGRPVFDFAPSNPATLYFGNGVHRVVPESAEVMLGGVSNQPQPYYEVFYHIDEMKSGMHHPDGVLWFKTGHHARHIDKVSILDVLPTLLDFFGVAPSSADARAFRGESLMAACARARIRRTSPASGGWRSPVRGILLSLIIAGSAVILVSPYVGVLVFSWVSS
jgi:hypothetical protein